jgi:hypothetical protein
MGRCEGWEAKALERQLPDEIRFVPVKQEKKFNRAGRFTIRPGRSINGFRRTRVVKVKLGDFHKNITTVSFYGWKKKRGRMVCD